MFKIAQRLLAPKQNYFQVSKFTAAQSYKFCQENKQSEHKQSFDRLKEKIGSENTDSEIKSKYYQDMLKNAKDQVDPSKLKQSVSFDSLKSKFTKGEEQQAQNNNNNEQENKDNIQSEENNKQTEEQQEKTKEEEKATFYDKISQQDNIGAKVLKFSVDAWRQTFPNEQYKAEQKLKKAKEAAKKLREEEENKIEYSEEELESIQESIPEWKKTSLQKAQTPEEKVSLKQKLKNKVKDKFNQTEFAKELYKSDQYKDMQEVKTELKQFKEDYKDHLQNSPSNFVQGSLMVYEKAKQENPTAKAIRIMRQYDPDFDIFEFEQETRVIFEKAYSHFLHDELETLEKYCGEQALGYFKVLMKKREAEKVTPKYKELWLTNRPLFQKAVFPDTQLPVFQFHMSAQEIYCQLCKSTGEVKDGGDDRITQFDFQYSLRLHLDPDVESVGHKYELVEVQPLQNTPLLV